MPGKGDQPDPAWLAILDQFASVACRHYRDLIYDNPEFLDYFRQATPIEEIVQFKIGSRPSKRGRSTSLDQLRAILRVFGWMQCRHTLPGWYGLGGAIDEYLREKPKDLATLQEMYRQWPFWRTLIDNTQMILAKADMTIVRLYADLVDDQALADRIYSRINRDYQQAISVSLRITSQGELLENMPILRHSIDRRNPYVDPLSFIQLVLLKRLRSGEGSDYETLTGVLESINGVASGMKNTG